ncbi:MAG TPA: MATE family efflux transporter, partial [Candidatus Paceibacterota bacterium]
MSVYKRVLDFYRDPDYFPEVRRIAVPIMFQQAVFSGLNMLAVVFVGQKGDAAVAAVGLAGQISFLLNLVHFGIISGAAMFTAQFWGRSDIPNLRRV